jgi:SH3 domain protein
MRSLAVIPALLIATFAVTVDAQERAYIRDEIRVNMRAGPGLQYRILRVLRSGELVEQLDEREDWVQVRISPAGPDGWIESGYVTPDAPPSVTLPQVQDQLTHAEARVVELEKKLAVQTNAMGELEQLRARNEALEAKNADLSFASGWKDMATGASIIVVGMVIGLLARGASRDRKIKL